MAFWWTFNFAEITSVIMFGLHTFLPSMFVKKGFEIMDWKKCAAMLLYMHV